MVQSLLEDRFQLKMHREMRELPVFTLVVGKNGSKVARSEDQTPPNLGVPFGPIQAFNPKKSLPRGTFTAEGIDVITMAGNAVPISRLATGLQAWTERPVVDKTGLSDLFDFKFSF